MFVYTQACIIHESEMNQVSDNAIVKQKTKNNTKSYEVLEGKCGCYKRAVCPCSTLEHDKTPLTVLEHALHTLNLLCARSQTRIRAVL